MADQLWLNDTQPCEGGMAPPVGDDSDGRDSDGRDSDDRDPRRR